MRPGDSCSELQLVGRKPTRRLEGVEASGDAFTLMIAEDANHVFAIERFINQKIARVKLENFE